MNTLATVANSRFCNLSYPLSQGPVIAAATVVVYRTTLHHQTAATAQTNPADKPPLPVSGRASELFSNDILEHFLVQTEVRHQTTEALIFILQLPQTAQFCHAHPAKLQKCPSFCTLLPPECQFRPVSAQKRSVLLYSGSFS